MGTNYLIPLLGHLTFGQFNKVVFEDFVGEARQLKLKGRPIGNETINKLFIPLKMICTDAAIKYGWGETYNPFFGWEKLKVDNPIKRIFPFSLTEQGLLLDVLPDHWIPYFRFAFVAGLRPGEQMAIEPDDDIDWENGELHIQRAITMDEEGKRCEGKTKNEYSRRTIKLTEIMLEALKAQKVIHGRIGGKYFFSTENGCEIYYSNLRDYVWLPALEKAGLKKRSLGQTRHTFATVALSFGESPLWIASVMGHCDAEMVIKRYSKFVKNIRGTVDGGNVTEAYHKVFAKKDPEDG